MGEGAINEKGMSGWGPRRGDGYSRAANVIAS